MLEYAHFLRLLAEKVYTARLSGGQPVRDTSDFYEWLTELANRAQTAETLEKFIAEYVTN
jgi:hypothetical protein